MGGSGALNGYRLRSAHGDTIDPRQPLPVYGMEAIETQAVSPTLTYNGKAAAGAIGGIWTGVGAAVGTLVAGIITGAGGPSSTDSWHFEHIWLNTNALIPMEGATDAIRDHTLRIAIQTQGVPIKLDIMNRHLQAIRNNLSSASSVPGVGSSTESPTAQSDIMTVIRKFPELSKRGLIKMHPTTVGTRF